MGNVTSESMAPAGVDVGRARRVARALALVVVGAVIVVIDLDLGGIPAIPDGVGWLLIVAAGVTLGSHAPEHAAGWPVRLRTVGWVMAVLAVVSLVDWIATLIGVRPDPFTSDSVAFALWDLALFGAWVILLVGLLEGLARWFVVLRSSRSVARLRLAGRLVAWTWGLLVILTAGAVAWTEAGALAPVHIETWLAVPVAVGLFGVLAYAAWTLLVARADLLAGRDRTDAGTVDGSDGDRSSPSDSGRREGRGWLPVLAAAVLAVGVWIAFGTSERPLSGSVEVEAMPADGGTVDVTRDAVVTGEPRPLDTSGMPAPKPLGPAAAFAALVVSSPSTDELVLLTEDGTTRRYTIPVQAMGTATWGGWVVAAGHSPAGLVIVDPTDGEVKAAISYQGIADTRDLQASALTVVDDDAYLVTSDAERARLVRFSLVSGEYDTLDLDARGSYQADACATGRDLYVGLIDEVVRVDLDTFTVDHRITTDGPIGGLDCDDTQLVVTDWTSPQADVFRLPDLEFDRTVTWEGTGGRGLLITDDGRYYIVDPAGTLVRCSTDDRACDAPLEVGSDTRDVVAWGDSLFVTQYTAFVDEGTLIEIDRHNWTVTRTHTIGPYPPRPTVLLP